MPADTGGQKSGDYNSLYFIPDILDIADMRYIIAYALGYAIFVLLTQNIVNYPIYWNIA